MGDDTPYSNVVVRGEGERIAYSMAEAAELVHMSRSGLYAEAAAGRLRTRKVGRRRLVLAADLAAWADALPTS